MTCESFNKRPLRTVALVVTLALVIAAIWLSPSAPAGHGASASNAPLPKGEDASQSSAILAKSYPASSASHYVRIAATADGFTVPDMQPGLNTPGSRWKNPAKTVQPIFPKSFNNPVRVRCGSADVSAIPLNANPSSRAEISAEGNLIYPNAFGPGIDVVYRCEPLKTEEYILIRNDERSEVASPRAAASTGAGAQPLFPLPLREGVGGGVRSLNAIDTAPTVVRQISTQDSALRTFSWSLHPGALKPRLTPANTIELCDEKGVPRLRINAPEGKDATGKPLRLGKELRITLEGNRVTLAADTRDLEFPIVIDPTWSSTGSMAEARYSHTQITLNDGRVFVSPNRAGAPAGASGIGCELFDLATQTWTATGSTNAIMSDSTFTLLANGTILAAGGAVASAELYDPASGTWTTLASNSVRYVHSAILLNDGNVLLSGGNNPGSGATLASCDLYNPTSGNFTATGSMITARGGHRLVLLPNGSVLAVGGSATGPINSCEIYDPVSGTWQATGSMSVARLGHSATLLGSGKVLAAGGFIDGSSGTATAEVFDPATGAWTSAQSMRIPRIYHTSTQLHTGKALLVGGRQDSGSAFATTSCELFNPQTGVMEAFPDAITSRQYPAASLLLNGKLLVTGGSGLTSCELLDPNFAPEPNPSASPAGATPGQSILFSANTVDPDNDPIVYSWDFGDGMTSTDQNPSHSYSDVGVYTATLTVSDPAGATAHGGITINVSLPPIVRLQTSDVVAFATQPFTFDASTSTDPENAIAFYDWDFGDGTPHGTGQVISKVYNDPGTYTITLTITDSAGVSSSTTRVIEVLAASEVGLYNGFMNYKVSWNRNAESKDTLSFEASVNVGDDVVAAGTPVALEIVGQRFEGTLDRKLRDFTNVNEKWTVKAGIRHQPSGTVSVKLALKKADLGSAFNLAGVVVGGDPHDLVSKDITVHLEVGAHSFELQVPTDFKFAGGGTRARGDGASE